MTKLVADFSKCLIIGNLVSVEWVDISGGINMHTDDVDLIPCISIGIVAIIKHDRIKLCNSLFAGGHVSKGHGDYTAIPTGVIKRVKVIRHNYMERYK